MTKQEIIISLTISLFSGFLIFFLGLFWPKIPKTIKQFQLRRFFGKGVFNNGFALIYGTIIDSRLMKPNPEKHRFVKQFRDGRIIKLVGPWGDIVGNCEIRAASYLINAISTYRQNPIKVIDDKTCLKNLDSTYVAFGSPSSNELSELIIKDSANKFLEFGQDEQGTFILAKQTGKKFYELQEPIKKDYGIILKIPNTRFPGYYFIVCAGLGEWGTSGSAWYLSKKWNDLSKDKSGFGIVVEIEQKSDTSAIKMFPNGPD